MTDDELLTALNTLGPTSVLPNGDGVFKADVLQRAGIDLAELERWTAAYGGGAIQAGALKLRKGQRPAEVRATGRPQAFYVVPAALLRA